ncbi:NAD(P)H-binding protein [Kineococcus gynurae]|uniref:NAD(P)H-binding protein n=1 Tax=Kineococcus gynurae TaxID=452979 RepID=A0ABV5LV78_9ACTN
MIQQSQTVVVAGAHGQIARLLLRQLTSAGALVRGIVRNPDHVEDVRSDGAEPVVLDLESAAADDVAAVLRGADAVVFAAGAGPGSGTARKDTVDRAAAVLLADAAEAAGVRQYVLVSSTGVEKVRDGVTPEGVDETFVAYLRAKLAAEDDLRARPGLDLAVLRPGQLTDDEPTGHVHLAPSVPRGPVPRADVAAVLAELLHAMAAGVRPPAGGWVLELVSGEVPLDEAVAAAAG